METSIVISGFGGQGALFAGQLLAYASMNSGRHVTWIPSYGPEMRGGTAHCIVIISHEPIGAPIVQRPSIALVFNGPSHDKYEPLVLPGGLLVANSSLIDDRSSREDINALYVAANDIAEGCGSPKMMNMAMLGAMLGQRSVLPLTAVEKALRDHLPAKKHDLLAGNLAALRQGFELGDTISV